MKEFVSELVALVSGRNANGSVVPGRTASRPARVLPTESSIGMFTTGRRKWKVSGALRQTGSGSAQTIPFEERKSPNSSQIR